MLPIQYTYLFGASLFFIPWMIVFISRPDLRSLMVKIGLLSVIFALICEYFWWTKDWWKPYTITGTVVGIEDVIHSFFGGGVAATLYPTIFRKRFAESRKNSAQHILRFWIIAASGLVLFAFLFASGLNSFLSTLVVAFVVSFALLATSHTLILPALWSGLMMVAIVIPIYLLMIYVTPGFVEETWINENMVGYYIFGVPIEDFVFYFAVGILCFSAKIYYMNSRLVHLKNQSTISQNNLHRKKKSVA